MPFRPVVAIPVLVVSLLVGWASSPQSRVAPPDRRVTRAGAFSLFGYPGEAVTNQEAWEKGVNQAAWDEGVWQAGVEAAEAERQRLAAEEASARRAGAAGATRSRPQSTTGECSGFAIPDYIIQRESGGNPSAYNPSGAYGCAQTLLSHYSGGACAGLDPYTIDGQRECVNRLSNGGTNLAPWAATR